MSDLLGFWVIYVGLTTVAFLVINAVLIRLVLKGRKDND